MLRQARHRESNHKNVEEERTCYQRASSHIEHKDAFLLAYKLKMIHDQISKLCFCIFVVYFGESTSFYSHFSIVLQLTFTTGSELQKTLGIANFSCNEKYISLQMGCVNVLIGISPQIKTNMLNFYLRIKIKTARFMSGEKN